MRTMRLALLAPVACTAFSLPFLDTVKLKLQNIEVPTFIKKLTDPVGQSPLLSLHKSLVEIPSVTGEESAVGEWLSQYLIGQNFTVETQDVGSNGRINIYAYYGKNRTTRALLTSHIDVVPPYIPYKETKNAIYGRGSSDAKGSVAAQIIAVEELKRDDAIVEGDVGLLFVVGEETTADGMHKANELNVPWEAVIFGEPTEMKLAVGHKGIGIFEVISEGKASHSGYPQLGINANTKLIKALNALISLDLPKSEKLGESTLNVGQISGGVAANVIPAHAKAEVSIRIAGDLDETVKMIKDAVKDMEVELKWSTPLYGPQELDHEVEGFGTIVCSYGTDVPNLKGDHKKYLYGPGSILVAHGDNEHVLKSDLFEAVNGYKKLVKEALNPTRRVPAIVTPEEHKPITASIADAVSSAASVIQAKANSFTEEAKEAVSEEVAAAEEKAAEKADL